MSSLELQKRYEKLLLENGYFKTSGETIKSITIEIPDTLRGEHMASACEYVTITSTTGQLYQLFVKKQSTNVKHLTLLRELNVFQKEALFYNVLKGDLEQLYLNETRNSVKKLDFLPKCLYADEEMIVLENLVPKGYVLNNKVERQNIEAARMVLKNLAQFHALSYKMICDLGKKIFYDKYPFLEEKVMTAKGTFVQEMFEKSLENVTRILSKCPEVKGTTQLLSSLEKYKGGKLVEMIGNLTSLTDSTHLLVSVNHGDFWNNNLLFKLDPVSGKFVHNIFVDFQLIRLGSPNIDVGHYIYTSLDKEVRRKYWKELLRYYFDELKTRVEELNRSFNYTFQEFLKDYKEKSIFGFWMNICFIVGIEALQNLDLEKPDVGLAELFSNTVEKWIGDHPEKCALLAEELVSCFEDFEGQQTKFYLK